MMLCCHRVSTIVAASLSADLRVVNLQLDHRVLHFRLLIFLVSRLLERRLVAVAARQVDYANLLLNKRTYTA